MQNKLYFLALIISFLLQGCIGIDIVDDPMIDPFVAISPRIDDLQIGQSQQFTATYYDAFGNPMDTAILWRSTNTDRLTIDANGLATSIDTGSVSVIASVGSAADTLVLNTTGISNTTQKRTGSFVDGRSPYRVSGMATLEEVNGELILSFADDFMSSSGPGVYVFLGKSSTGTFDFMSGGNVINNLTAQVTSNRITDFSGERQYTVPAGVDIMDYDFVVLYCVTVGGVFGSAELSN